MRFASLLLISAVLAAGGTARADNEHDKQKQKEQKQKDKQKELEERQQRLEEERQRREEERQRMQEERERHEEERQRQREEEQERREQERERQQEERERAQEQREQQREREREARERQREALEHSRSHQHGQAALPTKVTVKGPVRFSIEVVSADVEIKAAGKDTVSIAARNCKPGEMGLDVDGDEVEAEFAEWGDCEGPVVVVLPVGSSVEAATVDGGITLRGTYKDVEAGAVAGDIFVETAESADVEAVQGTVKIGSATRVDVESVSGNVDVSTPGWAPLLSIETVNGSVTWRGGCAKGCRMAIESFQGNVNLNFATNSSFEARFETEGGRLDNQIGGPTQTSNKNVRGRAPARVKIGKGEGLVRVETYQGDLNLKKK